MSQGCRGIAVAGALVLGVGASGAAALEPGEVRVDGGRLTVVPAGQTVGIAPVSLKEATCETELKEGAPGWRGPFLLPGPAWAFRALRAETLEAALAGDPSVRLVPGEDFELDPDWAAVAAKPGAKYGPGTRVRFTYRYGLSRVDLVERAPDGRIVVVAGAEDKGQPRRPAGTPGHTPIATVVLPNHARELTPDLVQILDPGYDGVPPVLRAEHLADVRRKLDAGAPVTVVCFGDSITVQPDRDFRDGKGNYVDRLAAGLRAAHPGRETVVAGREEAAEPKPGRTVVVKAGVGGDDTERALRRMDRDVLARRPDLVTVMFGVNDENRRDDGNAVPPAAFRANLDRIVRSARDAGAAVIVLTPGMKNPGWSSTAGNLAEYAAAARAVAEEQGVCLVDNFRAWELVGRTGYTPMVLLGNCINHPVDLAHEHKARGLLRALRGGAEGDGAAARP